MSKIIDIRQCHTESGTGSTLFLRLEVLRKKHLGGLSCGFSTIAIIRRKTMSEKVGLTGLTEAESEELHRNLIQGTQFFGMIAALAHLLAYIYTPWLG
jgi:light-harvesting protein B-800-850 beta chain